MILSAAILSVGGKDGCGHVELWRGGKACFHDFGQIARFLLSEMSPLGVWFGINN